MPPLASTLMFLTLSNQVVSRGLRNVGSQALSLCKVQPALLRPKVACHLKLNVLPLSPYSFSGILSRDPEPPFIEGPGVFINGQEEGLGFRLGARRASREVSMRLNLLCSLSSAQGSKLVDREPVALGVVTFPFQLSSLLSDGLSRL